MQCNHWRYDLTIEPYCFYVFKTWQIAFRFLKYVQLLFIVFTGKALSILVQLVSSRSRTTGRDLENKYCSFLLHVIAVVRFVIISFMWNGINPFLLLQDQWQHSLVYERQKDDFTKWTMPWDYGTFRSSYIHPSTTHAQPSSEARCLILVGPFVYFHSSCGRTAKALTRLRGCAGSSEPSLVAYVISTIISWAGSNVVTNGCKFHSNWREHSLLESHWEKSLPFTNHFNSGKVIIDIN